MPLYDMRCKTCGMEFEHLCKIAEMQLARCPECDSPAKALISPPKRDWFRPHWNEHFDEKPIFVKSKRHMKELCLKYDVTSRALGDIRNIKEI